MVNCLTHKTCSLREIRFKVNLFKVRLRQLCMSLQWRHVSSMRLKSSSNHDDVIKWKHFPRYWPFVRGIHRWPVNSPHKGQWRGALIFSLICALNKRLRKQSWGWWIEASHSLWRHCNVHCCFNRTFRLRTKNYKPIVRWVHRWHVHSPHTG